jgi:hypothetical protein
MKRIYRFALITLFVLAISVFWLLVVFKMGVLAATLQPHSGVFPTTFNWWDANGWKEHLFLGAFNDSHVDKGMAYTTYTYPFLFTNYVFLSLVNQIFYLKYETSQNFLLYIQIFSFLSLILYLRRKEIASFIAPVSLKIILLFLILGILITNSLPYISLLRYNSDNFHFIISIIFCYLSVIQNSKNINYKDNKFLLSGLIISFISIIYVIPWMLCYLLSEETLRLRKNVKINSILVITSAIINYLLPLAAQKFLMLKDASSSFLYRSGLDGSSAYLKSTFSPYFSSASEQHIGNYITVFCALILMIYITKDGRRLMLNQLIFCFIPFLFIYIILPQFCTIHSYLVEFLFVTPCIFLLVYWLLSMRLYQNLTPVKFVLLVLTMTFIIMGQLMEIAKTFKS